MPELTETDPRAAAVLAGILAGQAAALHVVFMRGFADVLSNRQRSLRDVSRALKAQNQCRMALRLLLALRAVEQSQKNSRNRTNRLLKEEIPPHDQALGKAAPNVHLCQAEAPPQGIGMDARAPGPAGGADPVLATVEKIDWSANRLRQGPLRLECAQARLQKPRLCRRQARGTAASPRLRPHHRHRQAPPPHPLSRQRVGRNLNPTSPRAARLRSSEGRWGDRLSRSRAFARSPPRCLKPGRCVRHGPWHRLGSRAILAAKYAKYGGETCAHSNT